MTTNTTRTQRKEVSEDLYLLTLVAVAGDAFKASSVLRKIVTFL